MNNSGPGQQKHTNKDEEEKKKESQRKKNPEHNSSQVAVMFWGGADSHQLHQAPACSPLHLSLSMNGIDRPCLGTSKIKEIKLMVTDCYLWHKKEENRANWKHRRKDGRKKNARDFFNNQGRSREARFFKMNFVKIYLLKKTDGERGGRKEVWCQYF